MYKKVILIIIIFFLLLCIVLNNKEHFYDDVTNCSSCLSDLGNIPNPVLGAKTCCGYQNIVYNSSGNPNDDFTYDIDNIFGPKCLNTCLVEHVAKLDFEKAVERKEKNVFKLSREDTSKGFCHNYNDKSDNFNKCNSNSNNNCLSKCSNDRHCKVENNVCVEKNLNYLSGGAILNSTKCSNNSPQGCVNKYMPNIETIKDIYDSELALQNSQDQCE